MIESNQYKTSKNAFSGFTYYVSDLNVEEKNAWRILQKSQEETPIIIHGGKVYFTSIEFSETSTFSSISNDKPNFLSLSLNTREGCRIIRNLTYSAIEDMMKKKGYSQIRSGSKRIFYIPDNPDFVFKKNINSTEILAIRGFCPRIECHWYNKSLEICFVEEGIHRAFVPENSWNQWIGFKVRVQKEALSSDLRGGADLVDISNGMAHIEKDDEMHVVSIDKIKLIVNSSTLFRLNILNLFKRFNSFDYSYAKDLRISLHEFNQNIAPYGWFKIQYDSTQRQVVKFTNIPA